MKKVKMGEVSPQAKSTMRMIQIQNRNHAQRLLTFAIVIGFALGIGATFLFQWLYKLVF